MVSVKTIQVKICTLLDVDLIKVICTEDKEKKTLVSKVNITSFV